MKTSMLQSLIASLSIAITLSVLPAQNLVINNKSAVRSPQVGDSTVGGQLNVGVDARSTTATFPGITFSPTQLSVNAWCSAEATLLGRRAEATSLVANATVGDGTWTTTYVRGVPHTATNFQAGSHAALSLSFRIAGQTRATYSQSASLQIPYREWRLPLLSAGTPPLVLGPATFTVDVGVEVEGGYGAGLTLGLRTLRSNPSVVADATAHGRIVCEAHVGMNVYLAELRVSATAELGSTTLRGVAQCEAGFVPRGQPIAYSASGQITWDITPLRFYVRGRIEALWTTLYDRTFYDRSFGGVSGSASAVFSGTFG